MLATIRAQLGPAAFAPDTLPPGIAFGIALLPLMAADVLIFRRPAALLLGVALLVGAAGTAGAWAIGLRWPISPATAAILSAGLTGSATHWTVVAMVALAGAGLEILRLRFVPKLPVQSGLVAYALLGLSAPPAVSRYVDPASHQITLEPVALWHRFFAPLGGAVIDPVKLYVGQVPGPMLATSVLAVLIAAAWLWYSKRLLVGVLGLYAIGAVAALWGRGLDPVFQLDSGPLWFAGALLLAYRDALPPWGAVRALMGLAAGYLSVYMRTRGLGVEVAFYSVFALQMIVVTALVAGWGGRWGTRQWRRDGEQAGRTRLTVINGTKSVQRAS